MSKKSLPAAPAGRPCAAISTYMSPRALERWNPDVRAAADVETDRTISVLDAIGQDYWSGEGVTDKRVAGALRAMGPGPVTVHINSPGGDMFHGLAIYNLLREHDGEVTVRILGLAASAASIVAMAADEIQIARAGFLMIHNCWVTAQGNRHDLREYADTMEPFDAAMADIYAIRSGRDMAEVQRQMDGETWIGGAAAIEQGYADDLLPSDQIGRGAGGSTASAARRLELVCRAQGMSRSEAMRLISEVKKTGLSDSAGGGARDATEHAQQQPGVIDLSAQLRAIKAI